jgi:hypothetical protein
MAKPSSPKYVVFIFIGIALVVSWFIAPMFLPMWKWQNVDFHKIATERNLDESVLKTEFDATVRFNPRALGDPIPWQIVRMSPEWGSVADANEDEAGLLVRCSLIGDRTGEPPGGLWVGNTARDRYFRMKVWRFPPGMFGLNDKRPVLLYQAMTLEKLSIGEAQGLDLELRVVVNDDFWDGRDDGWSKEAAEEAAAEAAAEAEAATPETKQ